MSEVKEYKKATGLAKATVISFITFCDKVLHFELTPAQRVIAKICFDNKEVSDLEEEEKILAKKIFGERFVDGFKIPEISRLTLVLRLGRGSGKMMSLETELPTPKGFIKLRDLKEGDQLFDEKGNICNVTQLHPIDNNPESYKIKFDDGTIINACADHLWLTWDKQARKETQRRGDNKYPPKVRSTKEILNTLKTNTSKKESNHSIKNCEPIKYDKQDLLIDPYLLGLWLGDGATADGRIESADPEILKEYNHSNSKERLNSKSRSYVIYGLRKQLRQINVLNNKHIPDNYLIGSYEQRLALLQGLMDTDGCCNKNGSLEYCTVLPELANNVKQLINSLGIKANIHKNESWLYNKRCKDRYRITFTTQLPVFRLQRKLNNIRLDKKHLTITGHRRIVNIEKIDPVPMRCITVDSPSHLYLCTRSFIPTHNSTISAAYALYRMMTAELQKGPGDIPRFMIVSPIGKTSLVVLGYAKGLIEQSSYLVNCVTNNKTEEIIIKRPTDGILVSLEVVNKSKAGIGLRGKTIIDLLIDESEFMPAEESGRTITDKDIINGASPRIIKNKDKLKCGKVILISTPYPTPSYTSEQFEKNFNNPSTSLIALGPTSIMRGNDPGIVEAIEIERQKDPLNALQEYDCIPTNAAGGFFDCNLIDNAISKNPIEVSGKGKISIGIDLGFSHDCSAQVIIERQDDKIAIISTTLLEPQKNIPLKPSEVMKTFCDKAKEYMGTAMCADQHYFHMVHETAVNNGIAAFAGPTKTEELYIQFRSLLKEGKVILPNDPILIKQLKSVLYRANASSSSRISIILPRGGASGHTDLVPALMMALHLDKRYGSYLSNGIDPFKRNYYNDNKYFRPYQGFVTGGF